jgi:predicted metalloprotease
MHDKIEVYDPKIEEVLDRTRRIETRLMRLAELLGLDPSKRVRIQYDKDAKALILGGSDASIGNILDKLENEGVKGDVMLMVGERWVATIRKPT